MSESTSTTPVLGSAIGRRIFEVTFTLSGKDEVRRGRVAINPGYTEVSDITAILAVRHFGLRDRKDEIRLLSCLGDLAYWEAMALGREAAAFDSLTNWYGLDEGDFGPSTEAWRTAYAGAWLPVGL